MKAPSSGESSRLEEQRYNFEATHRTMLDVPPCVLKHELRFYSFRLGCRRDNIGFSVAHRLQQWRGVATTTTSSCALVRAKAALFVADFALQNLFACKLRFTGRWQQHHSRRSRTNRCCCFSWARLCAYCLLPLVRWFWVVCAV